MTKPGSNPYTRKLKPVMTKYLTGRFGAAEGASRWQRTLQIAQQYWDETAYIGGRENILADNLYMSEVLFAAVEACDRDFPGEDILRLGDELMVDKIRRLSRFVNAPRLVNRRWVQRLVGRMYGSYIKKVRHPGLGQHLDHGGQPLLARGGHRLAVHILPAGRVRQGARPAPLGRVPVPDGPSYGRGRRVQADPQAHDRGRGRRMRLLDCG